MGRGREGREGEEVNWKVRRASKMGRQAGRGRGERERERGRERERR